MTTWLEGCAAARTVTAIALTRSAGIVEPGATDEGCSGMTEMAIQRGRYMRAVFTGRRHAVAGRAVVHDAGVIEHRASEGTGAMTDAAVLVGGYMAN